jgi:hypothetical protein
LKVDVGKMRHFDKDWTSGTFDGHSPARLMMFHGVFETPAGGAAKKPVAVEPQRHFSVPSIFAAVGSGWHAHTIKIGGNRFAGFRAFFTHP